jgi:quinolinate synthase
MTVQQIFEDLHAKIGAYTPEPELWIKARLAYEINQLKVERNAVILGHNYMEPALFHTVPDIVGDSLYLSRKAAETDKDIIVFCGVRFMAETAKILNPEKTVLIPALPAGCSLAAGITAEDVRQPQSPVSRRARRHLHQHLRRRESGKRHLLHLRQRPGGGRIAGNRHRHLPAR